MPILTQSLEQWLWRYHREKLPLILFGHLELFTEEMAREYVAWCDTEEGRKYLKGGSEYDEKHRGNIARDKADAVPAYLDDRTESGLLDE